LDELDPASAAVLAYSMAYSKVRKEDLMDRIAQYACEKGREFNSRQMVMVVWSLAVLNCRNYGAPLVQSIIEDIAKSPAKYTDSDICTFMYSAALLSGPSSALWIFKIWFQTKLPERELNEYCYGMIYHMFASVQAELGVPIEELKFGRLVQREYQTSEASMVASDQHRRLAERLRLQNIPHQFNAIPPVLKGFRQAALFVDIAIPMLKLVIEVEGPQRSVIPFDKLQEKMKESEVPVKLASSAPPEVLSQVREYVECGLSGSAEFKRRVLRKCGWRVVTVSFDESEEYIADALKRMIKKYQDENDEQFQELPEAGAAPEVFREEPEELQEEALQSDITEFEVKLRERHEKTMEDLRLRIAEERGNVASASKFANHLEYRKWQVDLEKKLLKEMVADLIPSEASA